MSVYKQTEIENGVVKQITYQKDVWELIKLFLITNRSKLSVKLKILDLPTLCDIYKKYFLRRLINMQDDCLPLEYRKKLIKDAIIKRCEANPEQYTIMKNELI